MSKQLDMTPQPDLSQKTGTGPVRTRLPGLTRNTLCDLGSLNKELEKIRRIAARDEATLRDGLRALEPVDPPSASTPPNATSAA